MKRIVLLNGSSEKFDALPLIAAKAFIEGLNEDNSYEVITIDLYDKNIEYCTGCKECLTTEDRCCICDDLAAVADKLKDATHIVWVAPIYSLSFPPKVVALMERLLTFTISCKDRGAIDYSPQNILFTTCGCYCYENRFEYLIRYAELLFGKATAKLLCPKNSYEDSDSEAVDNGSFMEYYLKAGKEYRKSSFISKETKVELYGSFMSKEDLSKLYRYLPEDERPNSPYYYINDIINKKDMGKDTNILLLFLPWIVMFLFMPLNMVMAGTVSLAFSALIPILSFKHKLTRYDRISYSAAIIMGLFLIFSTGENHIAFVAYFIPGAMFLGSILTKVPVSAYYLYKHYLDLNQFTSDKFIGANKIISAIWGGLLIIMAIVNNFIMDTSWFIYFGGIIIIVFDVTYLLSIYIPKKIYRKK